MDQIKRYYELIYQEKKNDLSNKAIATLISVGRAYGTIKKNSWNDFLDSLKDMKNKKIDVNETMKEAKKFNLPVEEK